MMVSGCPDSAPTPPTPSGVTPPAVVGHDDHGHAHAESGPHGGHVIEIGDEQLHAEWTHDDGEVVVFLLDSTAKSDATISDESVLITTKIGETEKSYEYSG